MALRPDPRVAHGVAQEPAAGAQAGSRPHSWTSRTSPGRTRASSTASVEPTTRPTTSSARRAKLAQPRPEEAEVGPNHDRDPGPDQAYAGHEALQGIDLIDPKPRRVPRRARSLGRRQVDAAALHQPADRAERRARSSSTATRSARAAASLRSGSGASRDDLPAAQSGAAPVGAQERAGRPHGAMPRRPVAALQLFPASDVRIALANASAGRAEHKADAARRHAVGRRAAARRHRPCAGPAAEGDPGRRAGGQPRPEDLARRCSAICKQICKESGIAVICNLHQVDYARRVRRAHRRPVGRRGRLRRRPAGSHRRRACTDLSRPRRSRHRPHARRRASAAAAAASAAAPSRPPDCRGDRA